MFSLVHTPRGCLAKTWGACVGCPACEPQSFQAPCVGGCEVAAAESVALVAAAKRLDAVGGWCYCVAPYDTAVGGVHPVSALQRACLSLCGAGASLADGFELLPLACGAFCPVRPGGVYS